MKYRGLTYNREKESYEWVYGLPSYGYATDEVAEIGTVYGDFREIFPDTLGEQTPYRDKNGKEIYTGDIVALEVDGQIREFVVDKATVDREYNTLPSFEGDTVKVMDIYTYNEWYLDNWTNKEEPEDKPLLPANIVVLLSTEANYSMYYGAVGVTDEAGKTIEVVEGSRIPEQWVERRPPRRFLQLNSAPLCVPHEVDSWYVATVC